MCLFQIREPVFIILTDNWSMVMVKAGKPDGFLQDIVVNLYI